MSRLRRVAPCDVNGAAAPPGALVIGLGPLFQRFPQIPERIAPAARAMRHAKKHWHHLRHKAHAAAPRNTLEFQFLLVYFKKNKIFSKIKKKRK